MKEGSNDSEELDEHLDDILPLVQAVEVRDTYTSGHARRVAEYASRLAGHAGESSSFIKRLYIASLLHDLGKIGIPDSVLLKPDRLSEDEYAIIRLHSVLSGKIVARSKRLKSYADIVRAHHERFDGTGYPDGLKGESIPKEARYIAIADVFDAMTTERIYRKALSTKEALAQMKRDEKGFDKELIQLFYSLAEQFRREVGESENLMRFPELERYRAAFFFIDPTTGLLNRQALIGYIKRAEYEKYPIRLFHINIRHFSRFCFQHGMQKGDETLRCVGNYLKEKFSAKTDLTSIHESLNGSLLFRTYADRFYLLMFDDLKKTENDEVETAIQDSKLNCGVQLYLAGCVCRDADMFDVNSIAYFF